MRNRPPRRPVFALLAAELVCVTAWDLTGNLWCCAGAVVSGVAPVFLVLSSGDWRPVTSAW